MHNLCNVAIFVIEHHDGHMAVHFACDIRHHPIDSTIPYTFSTTSGIQFTYGSHFPRIRFVGLAWNSGRIFRLLVLYFSMICRMLMLACLQPSGVHVLSLNYTFRVHTYSKHSTALQADGNVVRSRRRVCSSAISVRCVCSALVGGVTIRQASCFCVVRACASIRRQS